MKMYKKFLNKKAIFILIPLILLMSTTIVNANEKTRSIKGDFFNKVFSIKLTDGSTLSTTNELADNRKNYNELIAANSATTSCSLYDRFGGKIKFIPYFGESKLSTNIVDKFYSSLMDNEAEFELSWDTIKTLLSSSAISNNIVYSTRPAVLSKDDIENDYRDSRVECYNIGTSTTTGGNAMTGNFFLNLSANLTEIVCWISSAGLFNFVADIFDFLCNNGLKDILEVAGRVFLLLAMIVSIFKLISQAFKVLKGKFSFSKFIQSLLSCLISLGFIFSLTANPGAFSSTFKTVVSFVDSVFDSGLNSIANGDEIVHSDTTTDNVRNAVLWSTTVFDPWCKGMFQNSYDHLYTLFDDNSNHIKMAQSNDVVGTNWESGEIRYNSKDLTGDVSVPLGNNKNIKNWAALAWSCQSIYHLNATEDDDSSNIASTWPRATATYYNSNIFIDNFRWIDAKLDISPMYYASDSVVNNYPKCKTYKETFVENGLFSLFMTLFLIPILIVGIRRLKFSILLIAGGIRLWYYSFMDFFINDDYSFLQNLKKLLSPLYDYFWHSMVIFIEITFFYKFVGKSFLSNVVYLILSIYILSLTPIRSTSQVKNAVNKIKYSVKNTAGKAFNSMESKAAKMFNKK